MRPVSTLFYILLSQFQKASGIGGNDGNGGIGGNGDNHKMAVETHSCLRGSGIGVKLAGTVSFLFFFGAPKAPLYCFHFWAFVWIFRAIQDGGARGLRFTRLAIIYVRISPSIYQTKLGHRYVFTR